MRELSNSEYISESKREYLKTINIKTLFYENTRFNEINSYEIAFICFEIAISQSIEFSINNLINAFNVLNPRNQIPIKNYLDDNTIKLINEYKDQVELYVLIKLTQAKHHLYEDMFNSHKKIWLTPEVVNCIQKKLF